MRTFNIHRQKPIMKKETTQEAIALKGYPKHTMSNEERRASESRIDAAFTAAHESRMARLRAMGIAAV